MRRLSTIIGGAALALASLWGCSWLFFLHAGTHWTDFPSLITGVIGIVAGIMLVVYEVERK